MLTAELQARLGSSRQAGREERHLLLVCSFFPPVATGGTYRPLSFVRHARAAGWKVTVVTQSRSTPHNAVEEELLRRVADLDVTIIRLPSLWLVPSTRFFPHIDGDLPVAYYDFARLSRTLGATAFSAVMASGPQFDNFELARLLARWAHVPLVLEYRDEWSDSPFHFVRLGNADRRYEAKALRSADMAIFTTRSQLERNERSFPGGPRRIVLSNGWDETLYSINDVARPQRTDKCIIRYVGNFGPHIGPQDFLAMVGQALALDPGLRGKFEVRINDIPPKAINLEELGLADTVFWDGRIAQSEVGDVLASSGGLLIVYPPDMERYIPGKFYEYVTSGAPILVTSSTGEVPEIVRELNAGVLMEGPTAEAFAKAIAQLLSTPADDFNSARRRAWAEAHSRQAIAMKLYAALDEVTAARPGAGTPVNASRSEPA